MSTTNQPQLKGLDEASILDEIKACRQDPIHYIERHGKVRHPMKGLVRFVLYPFQRDVIKKILLNRFVIILKGRQLGLTTAMAGYACWFASFFNNKEVLVLANKGEVATGFISKCRVFLKNVPPFIRPKIVVDNRQSLELENGSKIKSTTTTKASGRSEALSLLIIDEAALIDKVDEVWTAARPTLSTGGACIVMSTPKGVGNWFHKKYVEAEQGQADEAYSNLNFVTMKLPWYLHPERDQDWADAELADLGTVGFAQEHECSFEKSGNTVIDYETIAYYEKEVVKEPVSKEGFDGNTWVWVESQPGKSYVVCGDVARGDGLDFCAAHVIDLDTMEQCAEYRGKIPPETFGEVLLELSHRYNEAMLIVENNSVGFATIQKILDEQYHNLYWTRKNENVMFFDPLNWNLPGPNKIPGFQTTMRTRPLVISALSEGLRSKEFKMYSSRLLDELKTFIWVNEGNKVKAEALEGYNDDLTISAGIGLFARNTTLRSYSKDSEQVNAMLGVMEVQKHGSVAEDVSIQQEIERKKYDQYKVPHIDEDLRWLLDRE